MDLWNSLTVLIGATCLMVTATPATCEQYSDHGVERFQRGRHSRDLDVGSVPDPNGGGNVEAGRHISGSTLSAISETLGALNTVGQYLVNMTRQDGVEPQHAEGAGEDIPNALLTISKNVLGKNVTNTIAPYVREVIPSAHRPGKTPSVVSSSSDLKVSSSSSAKTCNTPEGNKGECEDLSNCPQLLLNLGNLRQSLCFKSLFVPGVCCPKDGTDAHQVSPQSTVLTTQRPTKLQPRPPPTLTAVTLAPRPTTPRPHVTDSFVNLLAGAVNGGLPNTIVNQDECGQPESSSSRVVGGVEADPGAWPWMAAIFLHGPKRTEFWCGGSLIGPKHVLTAAHCTRDARQRQFSARQFTVRLGDVDLKQDDEPSLPVTYHVSAVRAHPRFSRVGFYNDIAILVLDGPVRKSRYIIPLCLPPPSMVAQSPERLAGKRATVVGWGTTYYGGKESTKQRQAQLPIWRNEDCNQAYFQPITENFVCAGYSEGGTDACQGDSGGPLMMKWGARWTQLGVVSFGNKCGEPGYPGVYTRVSQYLPWIQETMK